MWVLNRNDFNKIMKRNRQVSVRVLVEKEERFRKSFGQNYDERTSNYGGVSSMHFYPVSVQYRDYSGYSTYRSRSSSSSSSSFC